MFGIPILRGRSFTAAERDGDHPVVIVSESMARALWPNGNGVGETFRLEPDLNSESQPRDEPPMPARLVTVVGVSREVTGFRFAEVKDARDFPPDQRQRAEDVGRGARQRRSRTRPPHPRRSPHQDRSEHGHDRDHANRRAAGDVLPADRVLGVARCSAASRCC